MLMMRDGLQACSVPVFANVVGLRSGTKSKNLKTPGPQNLQFFFSKKDGLVCISRHMLCQKVEFRGNV